MPFFDGDNGGSTSQGVTANSIEVLLYNDLGIRGVIGSGDETGPASIVHTVRTHLDFYRARYQTYGRSVRVTALPSVGGAASTDAQRRADATIAFASVPFATVYLGTGDPSAFLQQMALAGVVSLGLIEHLSRSFLDGLRPFVWTFLPDRTTIAAQSAGFACRKLFGNVASGSPDPTLRAQTRSIAILRPADPTAALSSMGAELQSEIEARCDRTLDDNQYLPVPRSTYMVGHMLALKLRRVTTVICYCEPDVLRDARLAATAVAYTPEWFFDDATGVLDAGGTGHATFGITPHWRGAAVSQQVPSAAFLSRDPSGTWDARWNATIYYTFLLLFNGIQSSGPNLNSQTFERGQHTFNYLNRDNPFVPVGGFGPYNHQAISDQSWIDTATAWRWDPSGTEPDGAFAGGCRRLALEGKRSYPDDWPLGDDDLFRAAMPCTAPVLP